MAGVVGLSALLRETKLDSDQLEMVNDLYESGTGYAV